MSWIGVFVSFFIINYGQVSLDVYSCIKINDITGLNPVPSSPFFINITFDNNYDTKIITSTYNGGNINDINEEYCNLYETSLINITTHNPFKGINIQLRFLGSWVYADFVQTTPYYFKYNGLISGDTIGSINFDLYHKMSFVYILHNM